MGGIKILLTFKESERWMYDYLQTKSSKSGFIKDLLKEHLNKQSIAPIVHSDKVKKAATGLPDFDEI